ncbi:hypothetical protein Tb927.8.7310 [Trypanosoma brucei brucei TREU927]|uniref:Uncharacterized protein n=1 Tax=Trypanosoma brucei brucei (strain 927/4 GUTat10.1) TaxID=185431 RepID=Q57YT3_TRYB2|nr:hypothetical protein Tb927.8.7310 [Trypanosoma brucei brucei TREU927]AAX69229.1 hypothetical protein Tb927.8.7310 [Trypanosoma brucei]AAZ13494.1 hypothetical protein Tb927.8.7310 [Trypanosoma brucei brucei TREU927]
MRRVLLFLCVFSARSNLALGPDFVEIELQWPTDEVCRKDGVHRAVCKKLAKYVGDSLSRHCKLGSEEVRLVAVGNSCPLRFTTGGRTTHYLCTHDRVDQIIKKEEEAHREAGPDCSNLPDINVGESNHESQRTATVSAPARASTEKESKEKPKEKPATETSDNVTEKVGQEKPTIKGPQTKTEKAVDMKSTEPQSNQNNGSIPTIFGGRCFFIPFLYSTLL